MDPVIVLTDPPDSAPGLSIKVLSSAGTIAVEGFIEEANAAVQVESVVVNCGLGPVEAEVSPHQVDNLFKGFTFRAVGVQAESGRQTCKVTAKYKGAAAFSKDFDFLGMSEKLRLKLSDKVAIETGDNAKRKLTLHFDPTFTASKATKGVWTGRLKSDILGHKVIRLDIDSSLAAGGGIVVLTIKPTATALVKAPPEDHFLVRYDVTNWDYDIAKLVLALDKHDWPKKVRIRTFSKG